MNLGHLLLCGEHPHFKTVKLVSEGEVNLDLGLFYPVTQNN